MIFLLCVPCLILFLFFTEMKGNEMIERKFSNSVQFEKQFNLKSIYIINLKMSLYLYGRLTCSLRIDEEGYL